MDEGRNQLTVQSSPAFLPTDPLRRNDKTQSESNTIGEVLRGRTLRKSSSGVVLDTDPGAGSRNLQLSIVRRAQ